MYDQPTVGTKEITVKTFTFTFTGPQLAALAQHVGEVTIDFDGPIGELFDFLTETHNKHKDK